MSFQPNVRSNHYFDEIDCVQFAQIIFNKKKTYQLNVYVHNFGKIVDCDDCVEVEDCVYKCL